MADRARSARKEGGAGDGPGGAASTALMTVTTAAVAISGVYNNPYLTLGLAAGAITLGFIKWWTANKECPQCQLIAGIPEEVDLVLKQKVVRHSQEPYTYRYSHPTDAITAIACMPVSAEIQSPQAEVIEGGINCNSVTIRLTPVKKGKWACQIGICAKSSAAKADVKAAPTHATVTPTPAVPAASTAATLAGIPLVWLVALVAFLVVMFLMFIMIVIMMIVIMRV